MKYKGGNIVLLYDGNTVYILSVDEKAKEYQVVETEKQGDPYSITESKIYMLVT